MYLSALLRPARGLTCVLTAGSPYFSVPLAVELGVAGGRNHRLVMSGR